MELKFTKSFVKSYKKLSSRDRERVNAALIVFQEEPHHDRLYNHLLKGKLSGIRAISAGFDLRIVFREEDDYTVVYLLKAGTHNQAW